MKTQDLTIDNKQKKMTEKMTGAEAVLKCLIEENARLIYGYPGGAIMPIYDELYKYREQINHVLTRHEQGATHAAQGYARTSGEVGVVFATSGPGATNLVTGIADAQIDSTPMVCVTGQVPSHLLGSDAFQETDIISISTPVTKWNYQITKASEIPEVFAKAFYIARSGRPGPVLIDITKDAQFEEFDFSYKKCLGIRSYKAVPDIQEEQLKAAAEAINNAKKPYVVWGHGVIIGKAEEEFRLFLEKTGVPAASTILGLSALSTDHDLNMGMVGMHGNYAPNMKTNECDVLIAIGMRFDDRVTGRLNDYARQAKVIHFEIDPAEVSKNVHADYPVLGNVKDTLDQIMPFLNENNHQEWIQEFKEMDKEEIEKVTNKVLRPQKPGLTMGEVIEQINITSKKEAILVSDVGQHQMFACQYGRFVKSRSNITSGGLGTMGFALPAAIGAKMGAPERDTVVIVGDGGFQMTIQELGTIMQTEVDIKIVVLNNSFLGMVRQWQELFFDRRYASTEMINPDFIAIAKGYRIEGKTVDKREDLASSVEEMFAHKGSYLLEVMIEKESNIFPMIPSGASVAEVRLS